MKSKQNFLLTDRFFEIFRNEYGMKKQNKKTRKIKNHCLHLKHLFLYFFIKNELKGKL